MMGSATVRSENVRAVAGHAGLQPDVIVTEAGRAPVIVEAEIEPARSVEAEARSRLGLEVVEGRRTVEAVIALRYPEAVADADDLGAALSGARLSYCVLRDDPSESRFPESGWLMGSVSDLGDLVRLVSVSQRDVDFAADALQQGIERVAAILDELDATQPGVTTQIARLLGMMNVPQTRRMACAIIANALVFHERIAGMSDNEIKAAEPGVRPGVSQSQGRDTGGLGGDPGHQLLPDLLHREGHPQPHPVWGRCTNTEHTGAHRRRGQLRRSGQCPRPDGADIPAADRRPQVPGHLLHAARVGGAARPACRLQDGGHRLVRRRSRREPADRRLRVRYWSVAVGGLRADSRPTRKDGRQPRRSAPPS